LYAVGQRMRMAKKKEFERVHSLSLRERRALVGPVPGVERPTLVESTILPDGAWHGRYSENGNEERSAYTLTFRCDGTFSGHGRDSDGRFVVKNGIFSGATGRLVWTEHSSTSSLVAECAGVVDVEAPGEAGRTIIGKYVASTGRSGMLSLTNVQKSKADGRLRCSLGSSKGWDTKLAWTTERPSIQELQDKVVMRDGPGVSAKVASAAEELQAQMLHDALRKRVAHERPSKLTRTSRSIIKMASCVLMVRW